VQRLVGDLEKAKKRLEEVIEGIKSGGISEQDHARLVEIGRKIGEIDARLFCVSNPAGPVGRATIAGTEK
jgi:hypothetical protein